jgi:hypothetical protein
VITAPGFHLSFLFLVFDAKGGEDCILAFLAFLSFHPLESLCDFGSM